MNEISKQFKHGEAFRLMQYRTKGGETPVMVEYIWNSRDGVTPFGITTRDGSREMNHVDWNQDRLYIKYQPQIGDRIFVDATAEDCQKWLRERIDRFWDDPVYPMSKAFPSKGEALKALFESEFSEGMPHLITVDQDWLDRHPQPIISPETRGTGRFS